MLGELRIWQQILVALFVCGCMGAGTYVAGMCGGLLAALVSFVFVELAVWALKTANRPDPPLND